MKILIVSDTHGRHANLDEALAREGKIDMLLHLGDLENEEHYIETIAEWPYYMIAGNNDLFSHLPKEREIRIGNHKVWMTHGNQYYVSMGTSRLREAAKARGMDFVLFGHTHKPCVDDSEVPILVNPGSISYPRQEGRKASYIVMEIDEKGKAQFHIKYI